MGLVAEYLTETLRIYPRDDVYVGRKQVQEMLGGELDLTISARHLHIWCVQFDDDLTWGVPPVIYVQDVSSNGSVSKRACGDIDSEDGPMLFRTYCFDQGTGPIAFNHHDRIHLAPDLYVELRPSVAALSHSHGSMNAIMRQEIHRISKSFTITPQLIGTGGCGKVYVAVHNKTGRQVACKAIPCRGTDLFQQRLNRHQSEESTPAVQAISQDTNRQHAGSRSGHAKVHRLELEYDILKDLSHPNVITVHQVFVTSHHVYIMQDLVTGGDLLSFIDSRGSAFDDAETAVIIRQLLEAVKYLHDNDVVHRDIKPDNILMTSWKPGARIVLTDFGHAKRFRRECAPARMFSAVGTIGYAAPEIFKMNRMINKNQGYSSAVDMWSVGTITAVLLTNDLIFATASDNPEIKKRLAAQCDLSVIDRQDSIWRRVAKRGKAFVKKLLVLDETKRYTAAQALQDRFFTSEVFAANLEAAYRRAIADWTAREKVRNVVQMVDTSDIVVPGEHSHAEHEDVPSSYFGASELVPQSSSARPVSSVNESPFTIPSSPEKMFVAAGRQSSGASSPTQHLTGLPTSSDENLPSHARQLQPSPELGTPYTTRAENLPCRARQLQPSPELGTLWTTRARQLQPSPEPRTPYTTRAPTSKREQSDPDSQNSAPDTHARCTSPKHVQDVPSEEGTPFEPSGRPAGFEPSFELSWPLTQ